MGDDPPTQVRAAGGPGKVNKVFFISLVFHGARGIILNRRNVEKTGKKIKKSVRNRSVQVAVNIWNRLSGEAGEVQSIN